MSTTLRGLTNEIAAREHGVQHPDIPPEEFNSIHTEMCHVHIPKLVDTGVVDYDVDHNVIEDVNLDGLEAALSIVNEADSRRNEM
uniref:DUF7344 domain-containing protein n=1 Tax=Natronococcus wangiae TaxID=3068275 RepID=UPI00273E612F|nr:hypothetical protein [Natronococcus sp. AD5]